tara:strand:+ start:776 stop:1087 length:312 start_codon:yes stop_codon:yes gene_type:complete
VLPATFKLVVSTLPDTLVVVVTFVVADDDEEPDELRLRLPLPPCMLPEVLTLVFVVTFVVADDDELAVAEIAAESCSTLPLIVPDPAAEPPTVPEFVNAAPES